MLQQEYCTALNNSYFKITPIKCILTLEYQHKLIPVNTNPQQSDTSQHEPTRLQHESTWVWQEPIRISTSPTRINTSQLEEIIIV